MDYEITVVANPHRKPLITSFLTSIPHHVSITPDFDLPQDFQPAEQYTSFVGNQTGAYRCFRGHQEALKLTKADWVLVFEDDAVPNREDWFDVAIKSGECLKSLEVCSLHNRQYDVKDFHVFYSHGFSYYQRVKEKQWAVGSLAYWIRRDAINRFLTKTYVGLPMDLYLIWRTSFALLDPSPFNHDISQGSLIDT